MRQPSNMNTESVGDDAIYDDSASNGAMNSAIYTGWVRHRRFNPVRHEFCYKLFMLSLDLDELAELDAMGWWFKRESRFWFASFRDGDYLPSSSTGHHGSSVLKDRVLDFVAKELGFRPTGVVKMLAQVRYFGYVKNPLCTFFCFDQNGDSPVAVVAEVHNTPWGERHAYALDARAQPSAKQAFEFEKRFHVSPFNPVDMQYRWQSVAPGERAFIHLENWRNGAQVMDATMQLNHKPFNAKNLFREIIAFPVVTVKIISAIYWQALKLWIKRAPFYSHSKPLS